MINAIANTNISYQGNVSIKFKINNEVVSISNHNHGTESLQKSFAKFITGNYSGRQDIPRYLDLKKLVGDTWKTCFNYQLPFSGTIYEDDATEGWQAVFTTAIKYDYLLEPISEADSSEYRLYLVSSFDKADTLENYHDLAYLSVSATDLARISPGTSAIVEWKMKLVV